MGPVKIGERVLAITSPADLDARMLASTGCTAAEQATMLRRTATPFTVARALQPMLAEADALPLGELADMIAIGDVGTVAAQVVAALVPSVPAPAPLGGVVA